MHSLHDWGQRLRVRLRAPGGTYQNNIPVPRAQMGRPLFLASPRSLAAAISTLVHSRTIGSLVAVQYRINLRSAQS